MKNFAIIFILSAICVSCTSSPLASSVNYTDAPPARMVVCVDTANVREAAGTSAAGVGLLHKGTEVTPLDEVVIDGGVWVQVGNVWINKKLLCEIKK